MRLGKRADQAVVFANPGYFISGHYIVQNHVVEDDSTFRMRAKDLEHQIAVSINMGKVG
jgi:hypothetical protein